MFGSLKTGGLIASAWQVIKKDKRILKAEVFGTLLIYLILVVAGYAIFTGAIIESTVVDTQIESSTSFTLQPIGYVILLVTFIVLAVISEFFNAYVLLVALSYFRGEKKSHRTIISQLRRRAKPVLLFSIISLTIGAVLNTLQDRIPFVGGKIIAWLGSVAWAIASMFSVAVIVDKGQNKPFTAVSESAKLVKKSFGDNVRVNLGLMAVTLLGVISAGTLAMSVAIITSLFSANTDMIIALSLGSGFVAITVLMVVIVAMSTVIKAGLYEYAVSGKAPKQFNKELLEQVITPKKAKKVFGW